MAHRTPARRTYPDSWSFPGGHVEPGETLDEALKRELSEEIGVRPRKWQLLRTFIDTETDPQKPVTFHLFAVSEWDGKPTNLGNEHTEIRWMRFAAAANLPNLTFPIYAEVLRALQS